MTLTRKELYLVAAVLLVALIAGCAFISSKVAVARADQVKQDMAPVHQQAAVEKQAAVKAEDGNQQALAVALAAIAAQRQQPVTQAVDYQRIEQMIAARMGAKAEVKAEPGTPDAPSATLPAKQLRDYMLDCDQAKAELGSCRQTVTNVTNELIAEQSDHAATKKELAAARTAMKGGGFWHRVKGNGKWLAVGAGVGAVAATTLRR